MDSEKFIQARKKLGKTQKRMAELLGTSLRLPTAMSRDGDRCQVMWSDGSIF